MVKEIGTIGLPAVQICAIIPIALTPGTNPIVPGGAILHPIGNPQLGLQNEVEIRRNLLHKALRALDTKIDQQKVFK